MNFDLEQIRKNSMLFGVWSTDFNRRVNGPNQLSDLISDLDLYFEQQYGKTKVRHKLLNVSACILKLISEIERNGFKGKSWSWRIGINQNRAFFYFEYPIQLDAPFKKSVEAFSLEVNQVSNHLLPSMYAQLLNQAGEPFLSVHWVIWEIRRKTKSEIRISFERLQEITENFLLGVTFEIIPKEEHDLR